MKLPNKVYNILKWLLVLVCPAICNLLITLNTLWNWNIPIDAIVGTITAISTCLGVILGISTVNYNKTKGDSK